MYYIRARIGKKEAHRKSLETKDYETAKINAARELARIRNTAPLKKGAIPQTLWDALKVVRAQIEADPTLKRRSVRSYLDVFKALAPEKPGGVPVVRIVDLTQQDMEQWWRVTAKEFAPATANFHLLLVRRALIYARNTGVILRNPVRSCAGCTFRPQSCTSLPRKNFQSSLQPSEMTMTTNRAMLQTGLNLRATPAAGRKRSTPCDGNTLGRIF